MVPIHLPAPRPGRLRSVTSYRLGLGPVRGFPLTGQLPFYWRQRRKPVHRAEGRQLHYLAKRRAVRGQIAQWCHRNRRRQLRDLLMCSRYEDPAPAPAAAPYPRQWSNYRLRIAPAPLCVPASAGRYHYRQHSRQRPSRADYELWRAVS